ncbi:uncharacterized protein LOC114525563 [Dendronephthya gigantea]|uniref:uncharacterized protein LOC114525563 n=1 Tax=Dendronephthya gigantea TaxID=151771 RepID=UPI00106932ED|nr:uncharacterized protein LOC114525563 [Dendronephthya gigantea]
MIYLDMKTITSRRLYWTAGSKWWCITVSVFLILHVDFARCKTIKVSSQRTSNVENESQLTNSIYYIGKKPGNPHKGTTKNQIPQTRVENIETKDKHDGNLVFYHKDSTPKPRKKASLVPKSTPNANNPQGVGDGLDLARASILRRKSSPTVVASCVGNQVTLKCAAEGNPAPEFTWYKGKQAMDRQKVAEFDLKIAPSLFTRASHLTLTPNRKDDFGEYQCAASNTLGATQQSLHRIVLKDNGEQLCTESTYNKDKKKYNSIIIGTVSSVVMLFVLLGIAGFVFWRVNQREAESYQRLKTSSASTETLQEHIEAETSGENHQPKNDSEEGILNDDFNAKEIGRLSSLLAGDWERLARLLGFHQHDINVIREDSDKTESRCADMLNKFRRRHGSRETLAESVEEMKDIETATAIRQKYYKHNPTE